MPREVDHDARRHRIAEAVCALIAERGIEAVTLRDVAAKAEVSMGAVQRAFPKDGMLSFALEHIIAQIREHGAQRVADSGASESARMLLVITLQEMALIDKRSRSKAAVWLTFIAQAGVQERFAKTIRIYHEKGLKLLIWLINYGQSTGEIRSDINSRDEARLLYALVDGITQHVVLGCITPSAGRKLINHSIDHLWSELGR